MNQAGNLKVMKKTDDRPQHRNQETAGGGIIVIGPFGGSSIRADAATTGIPAASGINIKSD